MKTFLALVTVVVCAIGGIEQARAAALKWDANTGSSPNQDGNGPWTNGDNHWWNGTANVAWNNATPDSAIFAGASTLTLGSNITAAGISIDWGSVTIKNSGSNTYTLTLTGDFNRSGDWQSLTTTINVPLVMTFGKQFTGNGGTTVINGVISGTGGSWTLNETPGSLTLNGLNTYTGTTAVGGWRADNTLYINTLKLKGEAQSTGKNNLIQLGATTAAVQRLIYTGGATTTDKNWRLGYDSSGSLTAQFLNNGSGAVIWQGTQQTIGVNATGARTLVIGGSNTGGNDWQSVIKNGYADANHNTSLQKTGAGKWILSGPNTYSGTTTVTTGTLLINGNQSGATGAVTVASGATLGGIGTVGGATTINGILAPGNSIGTLTVNNNLTFNANSFFDVQFNGTSADQVVVNGNLNVGGATLRLFDLGTIFALPTGNDYQIAHYTGTLATTFAQVLAPANFQWTLNYGAGSNDYITLHLVPEPATLALLALAGAALVSRRRR